MTRPRSPAALLCSLPLLTLVLATAQGCRTYRRPVIRRGSVGLPTAAVVAAFEAEGPPAARALWSKNLSRISVDTVPVRFFELVGDLLLAVDGKNRVHAMDRNTGESLFLETLPAELLVPPSSDGRHVILAARGAIIVIDVVMGRRVQEIAIDFEPRTTVASNGRTLFVGTWLGVRIVAFDIRSGREVDSFSIGSHPVGRLTMTEVAGDQAVLVSTLSGSLHAFVVADGGGARPDGPAWTFSVAGRSAPRATMMGERILVAEDGPRVYGLDRTGSLQWSRSLGRPLRGEPFAAGGVALCATATTLYALDPASGATRWIKEDGTFRPVCARGDRVVLTRSPGQLEVINAANGKSTITVSGAGQFALTNARDHTIYLASRDGHISAIR